MLVNTTSRYLIVPTSRTAPVTKLYIREGERLLLDLNAPVDFAAPEATMYYDLTPFWGLDITVAHESGKSFGFSEKKPDPPVEKCRPKVHFTAETGWINDPNGLVYYEGRWHMFFQHNPVGTKWGNMHWGHAVSDDLVQWEQLDETLYPDETGDMFSGSAIIDHRNELGLNTPEHEALLLFYTSDGNRRDISTGTKSTQNIAYSIDGAKTFHKYEKNPVIPHIIGGNRDPKVVYDEVTGLYVLALYLDGDKYGLFTSKNLTDWTQIQTFSLPGDNECPDIAPMYDGKERKWVLGGAHDCYTVCDFDPEQGFINLSETKKLGFGSPYAAQSFNETGSRRIRFSWNRFTNVPSACFNCAMSAPCEMKLAGSLLYIEPVHELETAYTATLTETSLPANGVRRKIGGPCDITLELSKMEEAITVTLYGNEIVLDAAAGTISAGGMTMPLCSDSGSARVRIIADGCGIEIFAGTTEQLGAKAFGTFQAQLDGAWLTILGEGSLDRLTIHQF